MKFCEQCHKEFDGEELYCNDCGIPLKSMIKFELYKKSGTRCKRDTTYIEIKENIITIQKIDEGLFSDSILETRTIPINEIVDMAVNTKFRYFYFIVFFFFLFMQHIVFNTLVIDSTIFSIGAQLFLFFLFHDIFLYSVYASLEIRLQNEIIVIHANQIEKLNLITSYFKCNRALMVDKQNNELIGSKEFICSNCGHKMLKDYNFCPLCGKDMNSHIVRCPKCAGKGSVFSFFNKIFIIFLVATANSLICTVFLEIKDPEDLLSFPYIIKFIAIAVILYRTVILDKCTQCGGKGYIFK